jgi:DNA-binding MarR family transcriptional regulator
VSSLPQHDPDPSAASGSGRSAAHRFFSNYWLIARGIKSSLEPRIAAEFGLDLKEYAILNAISHEVRYPTDLAGHLDLSKDMTSRALQKLLRSELLKRTIDEQDSRRTRLHLTPAGQDLLAAINAEVSSTIDGLLSRMQPGHAGQLLQHMETLARLLAGDSDDKEQTESGHD